MPIDRHTLPVIDGILFELAERMAVNDPERIKMVKREVSGRGKSGNSTEPIMPEQLSIHRQEAAFPGDIVELGFPIRFAEGPGVSRSGEAAVIEMADAGARIRGKRQRLRQGLLTVHRLFDARIPNHGSPADGKHFEHCGKQIALKTDIRTKMMKRVMPFPPPAGKPALKRVDDVDILPNQRFQLLQVTENGCPGRTDDAGTQFIGEPQQNLDAAAADLEKEFLDILQFRRRQRPPV